MTVLQNNKIQKDYIFISSYNNIKIIFALLIKLVKIFMGVLII